MQKEKATKCTQVVEPVRNLSIQMLVTICEPKLSTSAKPRKEYTPNKTGFLFCSAVIVPSNLRS